MSPRDAVAARRVLLLPFSGPRNAAPAVDKLIGSSLAREVALVPPRHAARAGQLLKGRGQNGPGAYAVLSRRLNASAVVEGKVSKDSRWRFRLSVRRGSSGNVAGTMAWSGERYKDMYANVQRGAPEWMRSMLGTAGSAPAVARAGSGMASADPEPPSLPPVEDAPVAVEPRPARLRSAEASIPDEDPPGVEGGPSIRMSLDAKRSAEPVWEVSLGPRVLARTFTYTDNLAGLPGYTLAAAPALALDAVLFPMAGSRGLARKFGFAGHFETSIGVKTVARDGAASQDTSLNSYWFGGRYRTTSNNFMFTLGADYGAHQFNLDLTDGVPPNVRYSVFRPSAAVRADTGGGLSLSVTLAYLHVLSVGAMGQNDRFPRDKVVGAEIGAGIGYTVDRSFDVRLGADLRHYAHTMNVRPGDPLIVGGALDEHFGVTLLLSYHSK